MTSHIWTNTPKFVPPRWGRPPFDPTQTGLCKFGWVWSSLKMARLVADWNLSSTELESENALGAFLQNQAPVLDKISGPMGARFLSSTGLGFGNLIKRAWVFPVPALDKNRSPIKIFDFDWFSTLCWTFSTPGPGNHFGLVFQLWARRAEMTPVTGPENPKT